MTETVSPRELGRDEIRTIVGDFVRAGQNAMTAGFDGVEVHSSNGYLFHQFFSQSSNIRNDEYGGSHENRARFFFEVLDALSEVMPLERIGIRLNPMLHGGMGIRVDDQTAGTFDYIAERLNDYPIAYLHLSKPWSGKGLEEPWYIQDVIGHYRKIFKGFLVANGGYDFATAESDILSGRADAVAFGVPFIANPDLPRRFKEDLPLVMSVIQTESYFNRLA
jgi:N-ethylmaleimide reductase